MPVKGAAKHLKQIMDNWEGTRATLHVKTLTKDNDGQVTDVTYVPHTITGSFPAIPVSVERSKTGYLDEGDITVYLLYSSTTPNPSIDDKIEVDNIWFEVTEKPKIDYDGGVPVGFSCVLRRVPNED